MFSYTNSTNPVIHPTIITMNTQTTTAPWRSNIRPGSSAFAIILGIALAMLLFSPQHAFSADLIWDNATLSSSWNTTETNWSGAVWVNDATTPSNAVFGAAGVTSVFVTEPVVVQDVTVTGDGYSFSSSAITSTLQIKGSLSNSVDVAFAGFLANSLSKTGAGALNVQQIHTYTGATVINGGTVFVDGISGMLYNGASAVMTANTIRINAGGILSIGGSLGNGAGVALGRVQPSTNTFSINGGTWQHTGTSNPKTTAGAGRLFSIGTLGATLDSATSGSEFSLGYRYDFQAPGVVGSTAGGTLTLSGDGDGDLNYQLRGTGGLIKQGAGIWKLSNANTYSGATVIAAGTLALANGTSVVAGQGNGSIASPSITISNGATFDVSLATGGFTLGGSQSLLGDGTIIGAVNTASGATLYPGLDGTYGTNTITGNLTLALGALCRLDLGTAATGANDLVAVGGDLVLNNTVFHLKAPSPLDSLATGTDYVLISAAGAISGTPTAAPVWEVAPVNAASFQVLVIGNNVVLRQITGTPPAVVGSATPDTVYHFDPITVSVTVTPGTSPVSTVNLNAASIGGSSAVPLVAAGGNVYTNSLVVGAVAVIGTNTLVVTVTDTALLAAGVNIPVVVVGTNRTWNGGGGDGNWSTLPNWLGNAGPGFTGDSVTFAGEVNLFPFMDGGYSVTGLTFDGTAGSFAVSAAGSLTLAGGGMVNNSTNAQSLDLPVVLAETQTFNTAAGDLTIGQAVSGNAGLVKSGSSNLTLTANASYTGPTTINGGTLTVGSRLYVTLAAVDGPVTINSGGVLSLPAGSISTLGSLAKLKMPAASMVLNGGTLRHTGAGNPQTLNDAARLFTIGALGATLDSATPGETFAIGFRYDFAPVLASPAGGRLTLTGEGDGVVDYSVPGTGGVTKSGPGTWTMTGTNNTYKGSTIVEEGTLTLNHAKLSIFSTVIIETNAVLNLNFAETNAIVALQHGNVSLPPGLYDAVNFPGAIMGSGTLLVTGVPEAPVLNSSVSGNTLSLSWAAAGPGWELQVQTNSLTTGLGTNWFTIPGSSLVTATNLPINPANPSVFFRLGN